MKRPHYSYSQLSQYLRCPLQYYFERIVRLPRPFVSSSLVLGSSVHEALAHYHTNLQEHRKVTSHNIGDVFLKAWKRREQEQPVKLRSDETSSSLIDLGVSLIETYLAEPPPENIVAVEQSIVVPLETSAGIYLDRPLVTILDVLCKDDDGPRVIELKTSGRRYSQADV
jgi:putative RecB family exonuclease